MAKTELGRKLEALRERIEADPDFKGLTLEELQDGEELTAAKRRIALLEGLLRECRDSVKYVLNRFDAKGSFSGRIQQEDLLNRIDAALKGGE